MDINKAKEIKEIYLEVLSFLDNPRVPRSRKYSDYINELNSLLGEITHKIDKTNKTLRVLGASDYCLTFISKLQNDIKSLDDLEVLLSDIRTEKAKDDSKLTNEDLDILRNHVTYIKTHGFDSYYEALT